MQVKIGTKISDIINELGVDKTSIEKIILGGPMMGKAVASPDACITKPVSGVILVKKGTEQVDSKESPCIRCGKCVDICPLKLIPCSIAEYARYDLKKFTQMHGMTCMECGCCSYICPARRQLTQAISAGKTAIKETKKTGGGT